MKLISKQSSSGSIANFLSETLTTDPGVDLPHPDRLGHRRPAIAEGTLRALEHSVPHRNRLGKANLHSRSRLRADDGSNVTQGHNGYIVARRGRLPGKPRRFANRFRPVPGAAGLNPHLPFGAISRHRIRDHSGPALRSGHQCKGKDFLPSPDASVITEHGASGNIPRGNPPDSICVIPSWPTIKEASSVRHCKFRCLPRWSRASKPAWRKRNQAACRHKIRLACSISSWMGSRD